MRTDYNDVRVARAEAKYLEACDESYKQCLEDYEKLGSQAIAEHRQRIRTANMEMMRYIRWGKE